MSTIILLILLLLLIGLIVICVKAKNNFWVWYVLASIALVVGFYLLLISLGGKDTNNGDKSKDKDNTNDNTEKSSEIATQDNFHTFESTDEVQIMSLNKKRGKKTTTEPDYYTCLINKLNDESFQQQYIGAVKKNYEIKKKYYYDIYQAKTGELESIEGQYIKTPFGGNQKDENVQGTKNLINEVINILSAIRSEDFTKVIDNLKLAISCKKRGLASLVGREEIKQHICKQILAFANNPSVFSSGHQNIILFGPPGSGKTTCATTLAFCYNKSGIFVRDRYFKISTNEILSAYVNESTNKTRNVFYTCLEGLLFLDEAYAIVPSNPLVQSHGEDAITEIVGLLHDYCGKIIFMGAGYKDEMKRFLSANKGLDRRFPHQIELKPYSWQTLAAIFTSHIPADVYLDKNLLCSLIKDGVEMDIFDSQAGTMLNLSGNFLTLYYANANYDEQSARQCLIDTFNNFYPNYHVSLP
jgi:ATP-dependent 26S proteasome regulatory subunit